MWSWPRVADRVATGRAAARDDTANVRRNGAVQIIHSRPPTQPREKTRSAHGERAVFAGANTGERGGTAYGSWPQVQRCHGPRGTRSPPKGVVGGRAHRPAAAPAGGAAPPPAALAHRRRLLPSRLVPGCPPGRHLTVSRPSCHNTSQVLRDSPSALRLAGTPAGRPHARGTPHANSQTAAFLCGCAAPRGDDAARG